MPAITATRVAASVLSPAGARARLLILMYHRVLAEPDAFAPDDIDRAGFDWQMRLLRRGFKPLALDEALTRLADRTLPSRAVCVTFDDGYTDNHDVALPVLKRYEVPATFFVATDYSGGGSMFNDIILHSLRETRQDSLDLERFGLGRRAVGTPRERRKLAEAVILACKFLPPDERRESAQWLAGAAGIEPPRGLMMDTKRLRAMVAAGMDIGGHTHTHPILTSLDGDEAYADIATGKRTLEDMLDRPVRFFAYPNGRPGRDYDASHVTMVRRAGFEAAVSTAWGAASRDGDRFQLPRIAPWDRTPARFAYRMVKTYLDGQAASMPADATPPARAALDEAP